MIAITLMHLIVVVCSSHLCFSFCLVFCWVIWVKQLTLWTTMLELSKLSFHQFQVSFTYYVHNLESPSCALKIDFSQFVASVSDVLDGIIAIIYDVGMF